jgi:MYXO-CTERM domain-containing protein
LLTSLLLAACSGNDMPLGTEDPVGQEQSPIAYGKADGTKHPAVVALLADAGGGSFTECSGEIVKISGNTGYVLTAAHCCNQGAPSIVVVSADYGISEQYIGSSNPAPPAYPVIDGSVYYDAKYNQYDHDFCMLKFSGANSSMTTLALPTSSNDGVGNNVAVEHVGFGMTNTNSNNTVRYTGTNNITSFDSYTISYQEGGGTPGPCEGDSGGPALIPAGAAQSSQHIVALTSFGQTTNCGAQDTGTSSRVSSEIGSGKFITEFLNDNPQGTAAGSGSTSSGGTGTCSTCQSNVSQGVCGSAYNACGQDQACVTLSNCLSNCTTQSCVNTCTSQAGSAATNELNAYYSCICDTGCVTECATECGGSTSSSSSSSSSSGSTSSSSGSTSGGPTCGLATGNATCDTCIEGSCCAFAQNCTADANCVACAGGAGTDCANSTALNALTTCLSTQCGAQCGTGSASSSSSSSGGDTSQKSGCSVGAAGSSSPSPGAAVGGLLLGLALMFSRRRQA